MNTNCSFRLEHGNVVIIHINLVLSLETSFRQTNCPSISSFVEITLERNLLLFIQGFQSISTHIKILLRLAYFLLILNSACYITCSVTMQCTGVLFHIDCRYHKINSCVIIYNIVYRNI